MARGPLYLIVNMTAKCYMHLNKTQGFSFVVIYLSCQTTNASGRLRNSVNWVKSSQILVTFCSITLSETEDLILYYYILLRDL